MKRIALPLVTVGLFIFAALIVEHHHAPAHAQNSCPSPNGQAFNTSGVDTGVGCVAVVNSVVAVAPLTATTSAGVVTITSPTTHYVNGVAVTTPVKHLIYNGTTTVAGTATVDYSAFGFTTILGIPNVSIKSGSVGTGQVSAYTTSTATILTTGGTTVSIAGINVVSLGGSALPYTLDLWGY